MDAEGEGGHDVHRERRGSSRMLAVVLAVQNALVAACLLVFWIVHNQVTASVENVHIHFESISSILGNATLQFGHVYSKNMMSLSEGKTEIYLNCTGPYVLHIDLCYMSLDLEKGHLDTSGYHVEAHTTGLLQLQVEGSRTPRSSFRLQASSLKVCRGLHSIAFLRANEQASLRLYSEGSFMMSEVRVGLSYLLGTATQCFF